MGEQFGVGRGEQLGEYGQLGTTRAAELGGHELLKQDAELQKAALGLEAQVAFGGVVKGGMVLLVGD